MEIFKCTESQPHWYVSDRKPIKFLICGKKAKIFAKNDSLRLII